MTTHTMEGLFNACFTNCAHKTCSCSVYMRTWLTLGSWSFSLRPDYTNIRPPYSGLWSLPLGAAVDELVCCWKPRTLVFTVTLELDGQPGGVWRHGDVIDIVAELSDRWDGSCVVHSISHEDLDTGRRCETAVRTESTEKTNEHTGHQMAYCNEIDCQLINASRPRRYENSCHDWSDWSTCHCLVTNKLRSS